MFLVTPGEVNESMHDRLKKARIGAGFATATDAIRRFGWKGSTYRAHENSQNQYDPDTAKTYGQAYGVSPGWLLTGEGEMRPTSFRRSTPLDGAPVNGGTDDGHCVPVKGKAAAGIWSEVFLADQADEPQQRNPFPLDPRFPKEVQFDLIVEGSSLNKFAHEGDYLRCVDIDYSGIDILEGDLVVIERTREKSLRELSARRVRINNGRHEFWPESDDPRWRAPVIAKDGVAEAGEEVKILAKVLWTYRKA